MIIFLTSVSSALAVFLFAVWYVRSRSEMDDRIRALGGRQRLAVEESAPFSQRVAFPLVHGAVTSFMAVMPTSLIGRCRRWLVTAGDTLSVSQFFSVVLVTCTILPAMWFVFIWIANGGHVNVLLIGPLPLLGVAGFIVPIMMLRRLAKNRQKRVWRSLPTALDLLTTCVEAGLSLDFALQRVAQRYSGPLSDEIERALREIGLGKTRREALIDMAERVDLPDLMTFVNSIVQAEALGTSVGQVLRVQSAQLRMRRRQRAEQVARQAPVKMVFPLVLFLMPSLFIVTIGPVMLNVIDAFQHVG